MPEAALRAKLTGDSAEFERSLKEGVDAAKEFADRVGDSMKETLLQVTGLVIGFETVKEAIDRAFEGVKGVFEMSKELEHLSDRTGIATKDLVQLQTEFKLSGLQAEEVGSTINRLQRSIENASDKGGDSAEVFQRLGLNIYQLKSLNPAQQFDIIRSSIAGIEDPARRAQVAMQLFGRQGAEMLSLFKNGSVGKEAADALGAQADILANNSETFQEVASQMEISGIKIQGFFVGLAAPIGDVILPVLREINSIDLSKWGSEIGNSISGAITILYNALKADGGIGDVLDTTFQASIKAVGSGFKDALIGAADAFGAELLKVLGEPIAALQAAISYNTNKGALQQEAYKASDAARRAQEEAAKRGSVVIDYQLSHGGATDLSYLRTGKVNTDDATLANLEKASLRSRSFWNSQAESANNLQKEVGETFQEYLNRNVNDLGPTLFGQSADQLQTAGGQRLLKAGSEVGGVVKDAINQLYDKYGSPIPGQGAPNTPEASKKSQNQSDDWGLGQGKQIVGFGMGAHGWQGENVWAQGPANIETGMAGRAGRIIAGPHTVEQNTSEMNQSLKDIHTEIKSIAAPS